MKKLLSITMLLISSLFVYAQQDVTKFLGIPVDGSKSEMIQKLKAKGYTSSQHNKEILVGEFNGTDVNIHIATNNNKVCRIMVCDANSIDEGGIRIRFNRLCEQFKKNSKYLSLQDYTISEDEDISYEMSVHSKKYDALFYQAPLVVDSVETANKLRAALLVKYTEEQLANPTEEIKKIFMKHLLLLYWIWCSKSLFGLELKNLQGNITLQCTMIMNTIGQMVKIYN